MCHNFCDTLDLEFYSALEHADYGYINVLPCEYIVHLETEHCPMDPTAIKDIKGHYYRRKETHERLRKFATWLDEEQNRLAVDGIIIQKTDKFQRYLSKVYKSGIFMVEAITQFFSKESSKGWRQCSI